YIRMKHLLIILFTLFSLVASSQTIESLQRNIDKSRQEINEANRLLATNKDKQFDSKKKISLTASKIDNRRSIIRDLERQNELLGQEIRTNKDRIIELNNELGSLKGEYGKIMCFVYKNYLHNNILYYIFSSRSFEDLHRRLYYLKCYSNIRTKTAKEIKATSAEITRQVASLQEKEVELAKLKNATTVEVNALNKELRNYNSMLGTLVKQNKNLKTTIAQERKKIKNYESRIRRIMAEEARKLAAAKKTNTKAQTAEVVRLSSVFAQNKGRLPSPVRNGTITERWGVHPHPIYSKIQVNNLGINYRIPNGEPIRAVFDGVVSNIHISQGLDNSIIIRHGEYFTVYTGLNIVNVKRGDLVKTGEVIGVIRTGDSYNTFNFAVWKNSTNLNPSLWLR
ncbi:MAG: peptidoglycan DD-metalloendopeptidase family protein, partial [Rikenellaceae bacterium]